MSDLCWLTDEQMARMRPYFPRSHGKPRVDDRRVSIRASAKLPVGSQGRFFRLGRAVLPGLTMHSGRIGAVLDQPPRTTRPGKWPVGAPFR